MAQPDVIGPDTVVTMHYTLKNAGGKVIDSSVGHEPLEYLHGGGEIVPGLERALAGKKVGAKVSVVVPPEDGYGPRDPAGKQEFPREDFPEDLTIQPGMQLIVEDEDGEEVPCWVLAADARVVTLDLNHPLAGEKLHFDVEILALRAASAEELEHGHAHGAHAHEDDEEDADI